MRIYKISNTINDKLYIGQTTQTLEQRWKRHLVDYTRYKNTKFYSAINQYGADKFRIELIEDDKTYLENYLNHVDR